MKQTTKNKKVVKALNVIAQTITQIPIHAHFVVVRVYAEIGGETFTANGTIYYSDYSRLKELLDGMNLLHTFEFNNLLKFCVKNNIQLTIAY